MGATVQLFAGKNGTGPMFSASTMPNGHYAKIAHDDLISAGLAGHVSSARLFAPAQGAVGVIFFADESVASIPTNPVPFVKEDFEGWFFEAISNSPADNKTWLTDLGTWAVTDQSDSPSWDNNTWSALVVHTQRRPETPVSAKTAILSQWNTILANQLPADFATANGPPEISWQAFPVGWSHLSSKSIYVKIRQWFTVSLPVFGDYAAEVSYWLHFSQSGGVPSGQVARWSYWVESGMKAWAIGDFMNVAAQGGALRINQALPVALAAVPKPVTGIYFLPGPAPKPIPLGSGERSMVGNRTDNDVTVIFEH